MNYAVMHGFTNIKLIVVMLTRLITVNAKD